MANVLLLLSQGRSGGGTEEIDYVVQSSERVFECRTCNRQFPSFQALGGHRASHKKPRLDGHGPRQPAAPASSWRRRRSRAGSFLDLNLPPLEDDIKLGRGSEVMDEIPMVDCWHR
ncbi:hypothetical protein OPV22_004595 [Ensete ventricosum]|uniref:C2H2-type domain-containing protein n=1 Tax=Ensete ventricosum TaxID=4639 RepID=A0AAV8RJ64_ENSVE|nr:hypothetical protein OPV22_004595 [Ensete ventricosum]